MLLGLDVNEARCIGWRGCGCGWGCGRVGFAAVMVSGKDAPGSEDAHVVCLCCGERTNFLKRSRVMKCKDKGER